MTADTSSSLERLGLSRIARDPKAIAALVVLAVCMIWILIYAFSCSSRRSSITTPTIATPAMSLVASLRDAVPVVESDPERYNYTVIAAVLVPKPGVTADEDGVIDPDSMVEVVVIGGSAWNTRNIQELRAALQPVLDNAPEDQRQIEVRWEVTPDAPF